MNVPRTSMTGSSISKSRSKEMYFKREYTLICCCTSYLVQKAHIPNADTSYVKRAGQNDWAIFGQSHTVAFSSDKFYVGIASSSGKITEMATLKGSGLHASNYLSIDIGGGSIEGKVTENVETGEIELVGSGRGNEGYILVNDLTTTFS